MSQGLSLFDRGCFFASLTLANDWAVRPEMESGWRMRALVRPTIVVDRAFEILAGAKISRRSRVRDLRRPKCLVGRVFKIFEGSKNVVARVFENLGVLTFGVARVFEIFEGAGVLHLAACSRTWRA
jgi:hypothetical protein